VLAIAVFGIVMVKAFGSHLDYSLGQLALPPGVLQKLRSDEIRLAGLRVPASLDSHVRNAIREMIGEAFVFGFRIVILICAGLSAASAVIAWLMIPTEGGRARGIANSAHPL
jgi:hypothetical protein